MDLRPERRMMSMMFLSLLIHVIGCLETAANLVCAREFENAILIWPEKSTNIIHLVENRAWYKDEIYVSSIYKNIFMKGPGYEDRLKYVGDGNIEIKNVTRNDSGNYRRISGFRGVSGTLDAFVNLQVIDAPANACKPVVSHEGSNLKADLPLDDVCTTSQLRLEWIKTNKTVTTQNGTTILDLGTDSGEREYMVCTEGEATKCFQGNMSDFCTNYTVPQHQQSSDGVQSGDGVTLYLAIVIPITLIVIGVIICVLRHKGIICKKSSQMDDDDRARLGPRIVDYPMPGYRFTESGQWFYEYPMLGHRLMESVPRRLGVLVDTQGVRDLIMDAPVDIELELGDQSTQAQIDVSTPAPSAEIEQIQASGSTPLTTVGLIQAPTTGATASLTSTTAVIQTATSVPTTTNDQRFIEWRKRSRDRINSAQWEEDNAGTIFSQRFNEIEERKRLLMNSDSMDIDLELGNLSTQAQKDSTPAPSAEIKQIQASGSTSLTAVGLIQAPTTGATASLTSTTAVIQTQTSVPTTTNGLLATASASTPSTTTGSTSCPTPNSTTAVVMQTPSSGSTTDIMQASASGSKLSTTNGFTPCPNYASTTVNVEQAPTLASITDMQSPSSGSTTNAMLTSASGSTSANVMQTPTSASATDIMQ